MCCVYFYVLILLCHIFWEKSENNRIFYENNRHIFQELKNRIMGEKASTQGFVFYRWNFLRLVSIRFICRETVTVRNQ